MRYALLVLVLAGCVTDETIRQDREQYLNGLAARCSAYGVAAAQMSNCMMQLDIAAQNAKAQSDAALNALMLNQGLQMMNQPPVIVPQQQPNGMNCRRMPNGSIDCITR